MEGSQNLGVSEECHSSESGWTMYIGSQAYDGSSGSPSDEEEDHEYSKNRGFYGIHQNHGRYYRDDNDDDDDSMASDASSSAPFGRLDKNSNERKTKKKPLNQATDTKEVKQKLGLVKQKPKTSVQSSSKVRKSVWMGKKN